MFLGLTLTIGKTLRSAGALSIWGIQLYKHRAPTEPNLVSGLRFNYVSEQGRIVYVEDYISF
jgi:hypothetical protein